MAPLGRVRGACALGISLFLGLLASRPAIGATSAHGAPTRHVIEIMLENHSFDSLFGHFPGARGIAPGTMLPAPTGSGRVAPLLAGANEGEVQAGLNNSRPAELAMMDERAGRYAMDGYTRFPGEGLSAITGFPASMDPNLQYLARHYELLDANFQPVVGPTLPNVLAALAGTAQGLRTNDQPPPSMRWHTIFDELAATGRTAAFYSGVPPAFLAGSVWPRLLPAGQQLQPLSAFFAALARNTLPAFSFVRPGVGYSEEAPEDVGEGDAFLGQLLAAIGRSAAWPTTTVFITYDEGGGFWDGVPPAPRTGEGTRTPTVIVGPHVRPGVFSAPTTNLSILAYLDRLFGLAPLSAAQRAANDLGRAFAPGAPALPRPQPPVVPTATIVATGASTLEDPPAVAPGTAISLTLTARNAALALVPTDALVHLQVTGPAGPLAPGSVPASVRLHGGSARLTLRLAARGYYRLALRAPGGILGHATLDIGVGPDTP